MRIKKLSLFTLIALTSLTLLYANAQEISGQIVFDFATETGSGIVLYNYDTQEYVLLTDGQYYDGSPSLSPDGNKVAFSSYRDGNSNIYIINSDGTGLQQITSSGLNETGPTWLSSNHELVFTTLIERGHAALYYIDLNSLQSPSLLVQNASRASWSNQQNRLAFVLVQDRTERLATSTITGEDIVELQLELEGADPPQWSPDGERIAFFGTGSSLMYLNYDGRSVVQIPVPYLEYSVIGWVNNYEILISTQGPGGTERLLGVNVSNFAISEVPSPLLEGIQRVGSINARMLVQYPTPTSTSTPTATPTPTRTPTPTATPIPLPPADTNLLTNPSFASGLAPWNTVNFSAGGVVSGVLEVTQPTTVEYGVVWQSLSTMLPANTPMSFSVALGNSSAVPKRVQVILRTSDWAQAATCEFVLPANSPLAAYSARVRTAAVWSDILAQVWTFTPDGLPAIRIDSADLQYQPALTVNTTPDCLSAGIPILVNGQFEINTAG